MNIIIVIRVWEVVSASLWALFCSLHRQGQNEETFFVSSFLQIVYFFSALECNSLASCTKAYDMETDKNPQKKGGKLKKSRNDDKCFIEKFDDFY